MVSRVIPSILGKRCLRELYLPSYRPVPCSSISRPSLVRSLSQAPLRWQRQDDITQATASEAQETKNKAAVFQGSDSTGSPKSSSLTATDWEEHPDLSIRKFSELPEKDFGVNQHLIIDQEFKEALRQILWQFKAPIRYAFAYGSGVFPQSSSTSPAKSSLHPSPPDAVAKAQGGNQKMIDFIFGVSFSQHWHSLNLQQHRDHYAGIGSAGSFIVSKVQDSFGAGVYFNPYVTVNGTLIKYGVVNIDTLCRDLSEWDTLYIAGRLQKPVKILRDNPSVRLANQVNLISAVRTALLLLPEEFTEQELYKTITSISYMGDPRMKLGAENLSKVNNIVDNQMANFRRLYSPLIDNLPNVAFNDQLTHHDDWFDDPTANAKMAQNMDPLTRGHMVRRLPSAFRGKLYFEYQRKFKIPRGEFNKMMQQTKDEDPERIRRREGGPFEQRIAKDMDGGGLREEVREAIEKTVSWASNIQTVKAILTAGIAKSWRYAMEKRQKAAEGRDAAATKAALGEETNEKGEEAKSDKNESKSDNKKEQ